jgi:2-aminoadipate transaminase
MTAATFDFAPLLPAGLPAPAAKWTGLAKYSFVGGNNDPDQVPVEGLVDAVTAVLKREGKTLATYGLASGPQGYRPLREFLTAKLKRDAGSRRNTSTPSRRCRTRPAPSCRWRAAPSS